MGCLNVASVQPEFCRQRAAAAFLGVSEAYLLKLNRMGKGPARVLYGGRLPIYKIADLRRWAQQQVAR
jgi:hypothetical protein